MHLDLPYRTIMKKRFARILFDRYQGWRQSLMMQKYVLFTFRLTIQQVLAWHYLVRHHFIIRLVRKKKVNSQAGPLSVWSLYVPPMSAWVSFRYSFPPTSHRCACQVNWWLTSSLSLCGCERVLQWTDILPRVGFCPAAWAAGIGTGHLDPD